MYDGLWKFYVANRWKGHGAMSINERTDRYYLRTLWANSSSYQVNGILYPLSEIQCGPQEPEVRGRKLVVVRLEAGCETGHETVQGGRSSEQICEELMDPLCMKTTALAWWVGGNLHAKRSASAGVVVVEESRS